MNKKSSIFSFVLESACVVEVRQKGNVNGPYESCWRIVSGRFPAVIRYEWKQTMLQSRWQRGLYRPQRKINSFVEGFFVFQFR